MLQRDSYVLGETRLCILQKKKKKKKKRMKQRKMFRGNGKNQKLHVLRFRPG